MFTGQDRWQRAGTFADALNQAYAMFGEDGLAECDVDEMLRPVSLIPDQHGSTDRPIEIEMARLWGLES